MTSLRENPEFDSSITKTVEQYEMQCFSAEQLLLSKNNSSQAATLLQTEAL